MKRKLTLLLALMMVLGTLTACGSGKASTAPASTAPASTAPASAAPASTAPAKAAEPKIFHWVTAAEEDTVNPLNANLGANYELVDKSVTSLYRVRPSADGMRAEIVPGLADGMPVKMNDEGTLWQIKINKEAKWANGEPITAEDMYYSWKEALDPRTAWATSASLAENYIKIKNALSYFKGKDDVKWEDVGIKKLDEYTLELTLSQSAKEIDFLRHFYMRSGAPVYKPLYEACMNADRTANTYGTTLEKMMFNGPFVMTEWAKGSQATFKKNENWLYKDEIKLDGFTYRVVSDEATRIELFEKGESDYLSLDTNGMAKYGEDPRVMMAASKTIHTIEVNQNNPDKPWLDDVLFRKALFYAIDRNTLAKLTNTKASPYFLSTEGIIFADGTMYRDLPEAQALVPENGGYDPELAKSTFEELLKKYNLSKLELKFIYTENNEVRRLASEFLMQSIPELLGKDKVSISLQAMGSTPLLDMMKESSKTPTNAWDMAWSGLGLAAETYVPHIKFGRYISSYGTRYSDYKNPALDEMYALASTPEYRNDEKKLAELTVKMEKSLQYECYSCVPVVQAVNKLLFSERVKLPIEKYIVLNGGPWLYGDIV